MVTKFDFLQIAFENFRQCLTFALKFRNTANFMTFFEKEYRKASPMKITGITGQFRRNIINSREEKRSLSSAGGKLSIPKINNFSSTPVNNKFLEKFPGQGMYVEEFDANINFHNTSAIN